MSGVARRGPRIAGTAVDQRPRGAAGNVRGWERENVRRGLIGGRGSERGGRTRCAAKRGRGRRWQPLPYGRGSDRKSIEPQITQINADMRGCWNGTGSWCDIVKSGTAAGSCGGGTRPAGSIPATSIQSPATANGITLGILGTAIQLATRNSSLTGNRFITGAGSDRDVPADGARDPQSFPGAPGLTALIGASLATASSRAPARRGKLRL